ncbi:SF-assemblin [Kipferlia bialata]|uniref:SF-assemblin n=1 Tax=Kipferlia bialata TaxID=797122 RepID=A0A9K3D778_9EUKA|nr:SF-assemblin [Kipferlia bialata]|eukprot:g10749.t1
MQSSGSVTPSTLRASRLRSTKMSPESSPSAGRLSNLQERCSGFQMNLEGEVQQRRVEDENRLQLIRDAISHLDRVLQVETRRRQEALKTLQVSLEQQLATSHARLHDELREVNDTLTGQLESVAARVGDLERGLNEERETRIKEAEDASQSTLRAVATLQTGLENEKIQRLERESAIMKRIGDDVFRLTEKQEAERVAREGGVAQLRDDLEVQTCIYT